MKCVICGRRCEREYAWNGRSYWTCSEHGAQAWVETEDDFNEHRKRSA